MYIIVHIYIYVSYTIMQARDIYMDAYMYVRSQKVTDPAWTWRGVTWCSAGAQGGEKIDVLHAYLVILVYVVAVVVWCTIAGVMSAISYVGVNRAVHSDG